MRRTPLAFNSSQRLAGLGAGLVLQADPADAPAVARDEDQAPAFGFVQVHRLQEILLHAVVPQPLGAAHQHFGAVDLGLDAASRGLGKILRFGQRHAGFGGQLRQRLGGGVIAVSFGGGREAQQFGGLDVRPAGARRLTASSPVVSVPVLSKTKALIFAANSMSATFLMRMPRRAAAESAATMAVGVARMKAQGQLKMMTEMTLSSLPGEGPDQRGDDQHQRGVEAHVLVHDLHDRQLGFLRRQDQLAHAAQRGVGARAADLDLQHAGQVLRAGEDFVARLLVRRQRFAGDGGLVERALAAEDDAVRRHVVAGADADDIADRQVLGGDFLLALRGDAAGFGGGELDEVTRWRRARLRRCGSR